MPSKHAKHSPSSLGYKEACPSFYSRPGSNPVAEEGTMLHAALEHDSFDGLNEEQRVLCEQCRDFRDAELSKLNAPIVFRELELSICGGLTHGTADFVATSGKKAVLMDWKFGRGAVEPAATNAQGAAYSLGVFERFPQVDTLELHFVQPRLNLISSHTYDRSDVPALRLRIHTIITRANAHNKQATPGHQCEYCRKQATCAALRAVALPIASRVQGLMVPEVTTPETITDPAMMACCLEAAKVLKGWCEAVTSAATEMALNGAELPGFRLAQRSGKRSIHDVTAAYGALKDTLSMEEFLSCCSGVSIEALTEKISSHAAHGEKRKEKSSVLSRLTEEGIISQAPTSRYLRRA